jgi:hypothetical protein
LTHERFAVHDHIAKRYLGISFPPVDDLSQERARHQILDFRARKTDITVGRQNFFLGTEVRAHFQFVGDPSTCFISSKKYFWQHLISARNNAGYYLRRFASA